VSEWKVTVPGSDREFTTEDLTLDEAAACEAEVGETWLVCNPIRSAKWAKAILTRFRAREVGEQQAAAEVGAMTLKAALDRINKADDDRPVEHVDGVPVVDPQPATGDTATT
jgi:hypothetical protein